MDQFTNNEERSRYELDLDGYIAKIDYIIADDGVIVLTRTDVPAPLRGEGVGSKLIELTLEDIEKNALKVIPQCSFVADFIRKHPEWNRIVVQ